MSVSRKALIEFAQTPEYEKAQQELQQMLVRSATDMDFRQKLLTNPADAFAEYGQTIPEGLDLKFIENQHDATVVLPDAVDPEAELSEEELEAVAGGAIIVIVSSTACAVAVSAAVSYLTAKL